MCQCPKPPELGLGGQGAGEWEGRLGWTSELFSHVMVLRGPFLHRRYLMMTRNGQGAWGATFGGNEGAVVAAGGG